MTLELRAGGVMATRVFTRVGAQSERIAGCARRGRKPAVGEQPSKLSFLLLRRSSKRGSSSSPSRSRAPTETTSRADSSSPPQPDFTGTWVLVKSTNFDAYLAALDIGWTKRRLAAAMHPRQNWSFEEGEWRFEMATPLGHVVERLPNGAAAAQASSGCLAFPTRSSTPPRHPLPSQGRPCLT